MKAFVTGYRRAFPDAEHEDQVAEDDKVVTRWRAEHLCNLRALPREGFRFSAVPLQLAGAAPVRVFAELLPP